MGYYRVRLVFEVGNKAALHRVEEAVRALTRTTPTATAEVLASGVVTFVISVPALSPAAALRDATRVLESSFIAHKAESWGAFMLAEVVHAPPPGRRGPQKKGHPPAG